MAAGTDARRASGRPGTARHRHAPGLLLAADSDAIFTHLRVARPTTLADAERLVVQAEADLRAGTSATWAQVVDGEVAGVTSCYDLSPLGATTEGFLRKHKRRRDGTWRTTVQFSVTDDDWPRVRRALQAQADR